MQRVKLGLVCLSWLCLASAASAQSSSDPVASPAGNATLPSSGGSAVVSGGGIFDGTYLDLRHVIGDGVGYVNSYSQIGAFTPVWITDDALIAPNARFILTNSSQTGVNVGLVGRQYLSGLDRLIGVYGYYDNDQDQYNYRYDQFTVGAETLGQWWDLRANGYLLNGTQNNYLAPLSVGGNPYFVGNNIMFQGVNLRDQALGGVDAEFGVPLTPSTPWLRGYSGIYGYHSAQGTAVGYRGRLEANVASDLSLGMIVSTDPLYGTNLNGIIEFKFSGFRPTTYFPNLTTRQRMLSTVQRNWRVATHTYTQNVDIAASNPNAPTPTPYFVTFVNNTAPAGGNGTFEHPFSALPPSAPGNIIFVENGNSSPSNPVHGSITLQNNQVLVGAGYPYPIALTATNGNTLNGTYTLPGTSSSNPFPVLGGTAGNVITLANNNEVTGVTIMGAGGSGITNSPTTGSSNFYLHDMNIIGNSGYGISLTNATNNPASTNFISMYNGSLVNGSIISNINNTFTDNGGLTNPAGLGGNTLGGIQIATGASGLNLQMTSVNMDGTPAAPQAFGLSFTAINGPLSVNMGNVSTSGNGTGMIFNEQNQTVTVNMNVNPDGTANGLGINANSNAGTGIEFEGSGGAINLTATNVNANLNGSDNLQIGSQAAPLMNTNINVNVNNSNFNSSAGGSGVMYSLMGSSPNVASLVLTNVSSSNNFNYGLGMFGNGSSMNATVTNGTFTNNFDAFHVVGSGGAILGLTVDPTNAQNSGNDGLFYSLTDSGTRLGVSFMNDNLNNSGQLVAPASAVSVGNAVHGELSNNAFAGLTFVNTTAQGSAGDGFYLNAASSSMAIANITGGTFANSGVRTIGSGAFDVNLSGGSNVAINTNGNIGNNLTPGNTMGTQSYGLNVNASGASLFNGTFINGDFSDSTVNAVNFVSNSGSAVNVILAGTSGNNSGADGINGYVSGAGSTATLTIESATAGGNAGTFNNNGANGLNFTANQNGMLTVNGYNTMFNNNGAGGAGGSGILGLVDTNGNAVLNFTGTTFNSNLDNGIYVQAQNGGNVQASLIGGQVNANGNASLTSRFNDGILLSLTGATNSSLNLSGGTTVSSNGNDGVAIVAQNGTVFTGNFNNVSLLNNGTASNPASLPYTGAGLNVTTETTTAGDTTFSNLTFTSVTSGNTGSSVSQQVGFLATTTGDGAVGDTTKLTANVTGSNFTKNVTGLDLETSADGIANVTVTSSNIYANTTGFLSNTTAGGNMNTSFMGSSLSSNTSNAINATVDGTGSVASINLNSTAANLSGSDGADLIATNGATLNFGAASNSSISNSGGNGILVLADGAGTVANFNLASLTLSSNGTSGFGGMGFDGVVADGATLNAVISGTTAINGNASQGIGLTVDGAGSAAYFDLSGATQVTGNTGGGLTIGATNNATVYYRSAGSTYSSNGGAGVTLSADNSTLLTLFDGDSINSNAGDGFNLSATNGAVMTTSLTNDLITSNTGYGIDIANVSGTTTQFNLIMSGANTATTNNTLGAFNSLNFSNVGQVVLQLVGSFNGNTTGSGLSVSMNNVTNTIVSVNGEGTGTANNNTGGDGINVNITGSTNAAVMIGGFAAISGNEDDGVDISMTNVSNGAVQVSGATPTTYTTYNGNITQNAVEVDLTGTTLVNNFSLGAVTSIPGLQPSAPANNQPTVTTPIFSLTTLPKNVGITISSIAPTTALSISGVNGINSGMNGIYVNAANSTIADNGSFIMNNLISGSKNGDGILVSLSSTTANDLTIENNGSQSNSGNGINLNLQNSPITNLLIQNNNVASGTANVGAGLSNNGLDGLRLGLNNSTLLNMQILGNTITNNGTTGTGQGVEFTDVTGGTNAVQNSDITDAAFANNTITGNNGDGIHLVNPNTPTSQISMSFTGDTISNNTGMGVNLNLVSGQQDLVANFTNEQIKSNTGGAGVNIVLADNHSLLTSNIDGSITSGFTGNTISSNSGAGINFTMGLNGNITTNFVNNTIDTNKAQGINFGMGQGGTLTSDFTGNTISGNTSQGILLTLGTGGSFFGNNFYGNTISNNGSEGVSLIAPDQSSFFWNMNGTAANPNIISGNSNADVGITLTGSATGTLDVAHTTFSNAKAGADTNFAGEGLRVNMSGTSTLSGTVVSSSFTGNVGDGAMFNVIGNSSISAHSILSNLTIGGGTLALDNTFTGNGGNGLEFQRNADAEINNVTIQNNILDSNTGGSGLKITATQYFHDDSYTIDDNDISKNSQNGVWFFEQADAGFTANMNLNTIETNGSNGILLTEQVNAPTNKRELSGTWTQNTITGNIGGDGIALDGAVGTLLIGDPTDTTLGNIISSNHLNGIENSGATFNSLTIGANMIEFNGTNASVGGAPGRNSAGIYLDVASYSNVTVESNLIEYNLGDGVQYAPSVRGNEVLEIGGSSTTGNMIINNFGRGVDILNQGNNSLQADVSNNTISGNKLEGIYAINTASGDQSQFVSSTFSGVSNGVTYVNGVAQDGAAIGSNPYLELRVVQNDISGNGGNSTFSGTGLVIRVGTTEASNSYTSLGGFASTGATLAQGSSFATFMSTINQTNSGVVAQVDNNTFNGNNGNDVTFTSFTSTSPLPTAAGTWTTTAFSVTSYTSDPLSRFDLYFRGNTLTNGNASKFDPLGNYQSLNGNPGGGYAPFNPNNAYTAYYADSDGNFKSRISTATPPGPFGVNDATRIRNATREAKITNYNIVGSVPPTYSFAYPGLGPSTWRVSTDSVDGVYFNDAAGGNVVNNANAGNIYYNGFLLANPAGQTEPGSYVFGEF